jgi:hypothetical protein
MGRVKNDKAHAIASVKTRVCIDDVSKVRATLFAQEARRRHVTRKLQPGVVGMATIETLEEEELPQQE